MLRLLHLPSILLPSQDLRLVLAPKRHVFGVIAISYAYEHHGLYGFLTTPYLGPLFISISRSAAPEHTSCMHRFS